MLKFLSFDPEALLMARSATARISGVSKVDNRTVEVGPGGGLLFQIASKTPPLINGNFRTLKCK
jgi:hypothetical protein